MKASKLIKCIEKYIADFGDDEVDFIFDTDDDFCELNFYKIHDGYVQNSQRKCEITLTNSPAGQEYESV